MDEKQLKAAIQLGKDIANGKVDIVPLDNRSLELRGKKQKTSLAKKDGKDVARRTLEAQ
jgi:hypothetical protein